MSAPGDGSLAIAVVLLPPPEIDRLCRERNAEMARHPSSSGLRLDDTHLPHLTLLQQAVEGGALAAVTAAIGATLGDPLHLTALATRRTRRTAHLVVAPNRELRALHERLHDTLAGFALLPVTAAAFHPGEPPKDSDLEWVARFRSAASGAAYEPHITLGIGDPAPLGAPINFVAERVALCHLGRYCTCRSLLAEWHLDGGAAR